MAKAPKQDAEAAVEEKPAVVTPKVIIQDTPVEVPVEEPAMPQHVLDEQAAGRAALERHKARG
jgi:hypothetical protein